MDIRTMQYFLAVIREGTISAAAQALHVAQPLTNLVEGYDENGIRVAN